MPIPILSILLLLFILWLNYEIKRISRAEKKSNEVFWQAEEASNTARRKDISELDYITLDLERLPMNDSEDSTINSYRDTIKKLEGKKFVNLSDMTNTELKLQYGVANLNQLTEYDTNYTKLVSSLQKWAERYYSLEQVDSTVQILEYAVSIHSDVKKTYHLLASIYKSKKTPEKIQQLIESIPKTKVQDKEKLIKDLTNIMTSF